MLIGIESEALRRHGTGIANYTRQIVLNVLEHSTVRFSGFHRRKWHQINLDSFGNASHIPHEATVRSVLGGIPFLREGYRKLNEIAFANSVRKQPLDLFHAFHFQPLADTGVPVLPVIYDMSTFRYPQFHPAERVRWLEKLPATLERAKFIQTISEFSKREIAAIFNIASEKIFVASPAAAPIFAPHGRKVTQTDLSPLQLTYGNYFLTVGTLEPRKNIRTLVDAYARLSAKTRSQFPLIVVGAKGWGNQSLSRDADASMRDGSLRFIHTATNSTLRGLYEGARLFVMPSFYEGFGMPVVEALACGTPVAHSADTAMDEITNGLAARVPASDVLGWADVLNNATEDQFNSDTAVRDARIARSQFFSWKKSASIVLDAYGSITATS